MSTLSEKRNNSQRNKYLVYKLFLDLRVCWVLFTSNEENYTLKLNGIQSTRDSSMYLLSERLPLFIFAPPFPRLCRSSGRLWCSARIRSSRWWQFAASEGFGSAAVSRYVPPFLDQAPCRNPFRFPRQWGTAYLWWWALWGSLCWTWLKSLDQPISATPSDLDGRQCRAFPPISGIPPRTRCYGLNDSH